MTGPVLRGRGRERAKLTGAIERARAGASTVLVVRGEAGIGKSALLQFCETQASGCLVAPVAGDEATMTMPFAGLRKLCAPVLPHLPNLPDPQARALRVALGLAAGPPPDRFLTGLALLSLLAEASAERPLVCLVDDAQWLDAATSQVLAFVGRRLTDEGLVLVFGVRETGHARLFPDLPELTLGGLAHPDACALVAAAVSGPLDPRVRDRMVAETRGNPQELLRLLKGMTAAELGGGFAPAAVSAQAESEQVESEQVENPHLGRIRSLPASTRRLMLLAALDPTGDSVLLRRAAESWAVGRDAALAAESAGLLVIRAQVRFQDPLVRSAAREAATSEEHRAARRALAAATDSVRHPEHRVWHLAAAAVDPDEALATELENSAPLAQARGGRASAAAFLERSAALTADPHRRADRAMAAASLHLQAGAFVAALDVLAQADTTQLDGGRRARVEDLRDHIARASDAGTGPARLLAAAQRLEAVDSRLARHNYVDAWVAALGSGSVAGPAGLVEISRAARAMAASNPRPRPCEVLLDGLAMAITDGLTPAVPQLREAVTTMLGAEISSEAWLRVGSMSSVAAIALWDMDAWTALATRYVDLARAAGAPSQVAIALDTAALAAARRGDLHTAASLVAEGETLAEMSGLRYPSAGGLLIAAYRGDPAAAAPLLARAKRRAEATGAGLWSQLLAWVSATLHNGRGDHDAALAAARPATGVHLGPFLTSWVLPELVEAAARSGRPGRAADAVEQLSATIVDDSDWAAGIAARCRALVSNGKAAEASYVEAVTRLERTALRPEVARAQLLYGEWLRREGRGVAAREPLRAAFDLFSSSGAEGFAERARRELVATGEKAGRRPPNARADLTAQEAHIARLAEQGRTNPEIGAELFLSARTVEWHLRKVFAKLGIRSRRELAGVLASPGRRSV